MDKKCFWCANQSAKLTSTQVQFRQKIQPALVCSDQCEEDLKGYALYANRHIQHYYLGLALSIISGLFLTFWRMTIDYGALGVFIIFAGSGLVLIKYPFVTPQSIQKSGAKKAIVAGRILGIINVLLGIAFGLFLAFLVK